MTSLRAAHHAELLAELTPLLLGAVVRDVDAMPPTDLLIVVVPPGDDRVLRLRVSADPDHGRVHLAIGPVQRHKGPIGPFFQATIDRLEGARLEALDLVEGDRIVRLDFARDGQRTALIAELTGRHSNLLLCSADSRKARLLEIMHLPKEGTRAAERLVLGKGYERPGSGSGAGTASATPSATESPSLAEHLPTPEPRKGLAELAPLSWIVEASIGHTADSKHGNDIRADLVRRLARRRKSTAARLAGLTKQAEVVGRVERMRNDAELLKSNLNTVSRGATEITFVDWYDPDQAERTIALEAKLSPKENLARMFARVKKLERTREKLPLEQGLCEAELAGLDTLIERAANEDPDAIELEAIQSGWVKPRQAANAREAKHRKQLKRLPYHTFVGTRGSEIRVGRSAKDNDRLTTREARGNDLWFHTADTPGSHVVLRIERGASVDDEEVLDACTLALHFSPLKNAGKGRIHVVPIKQVRKPKGVPAGTVTLSGGKVREIRMEPERLQRLLGKRGSDA